MLRDMIEILSYMDWLRPLLTIAQNRTNGPSHTFLISDDCGWSPKQVEQYLRKQGIETWGLDVYRGTIMLSTTVKQAGLVQHLLDMRGISVENPIGVIPSERRASRVEGQAVHRHDSHLRVKSQTKRDPIDKLNDMLDAWGISSSGE